MAAFPRLNPQTTIAGTTNTPIPENGKFKGNEEQDGIPGSENT
jgi:hypothetical protein